MIGKYEQVAIDMARIAIRLDKAADTDLTEQTISAFKDIPGIATYGRGQCPTMMFRTPAGGYVADVWRAIQKWAGVAAMTCEQKALVVLALTETDNQWYLAMGAAASPAGCP